MLSVRVGGVEPVVGEIGAGAGDGRLDAVMEK